MTGHFYFTKLLLPVLRATAEKAPAAKNVRVVNVSSLVHYWGSPKGIDWNTLKPGAESLEARKKLGSARLYGQSKTVRAISPLQTRPVSEPNTGEYPFFE
jgi:retinol dehydrogenase 12